MLNSSQIKCSFKVIKNKNKEYLFKVNTTKEIDEIIDLIQKNLPEKVTLNQNTIDDKE